MGRDSSQLTANDACHLGPGGQLKAHQLFNRTSIGNVVGQWCHVIQSVGVGNELIPSHVFGNFLVPPMEIADIRIHFCNHLPIQLKNETQNSVGAGMGRPNVEN